MKFETSNEETVVVSILIAILALFATIAIVYGEVQCTKRTEIEANSGA